MKTHAIKLFLLDLYTTYFGSKKHGWWFLPDVQHHQLVENLVAGSALELCLLGI